MQSILHLAASALRQQSHVLSSGVYSIDMSVHQCLEMTLCISMARAGVYVISCVVCMSDMCTHGANIECPGICRAHMYGVPVLQETGITWNLQVVTQTLGSRMDARRLAQSLDQPGCHLASGQAFELFMTLACAVSTTGDFHVDSVIQQRWMDQQGQVEFLQYATAAGPTTFDFNLASRQLDTEVTLLSMALVQHAGLM